MKPPVILSYIIGIITSIFLIFLSLKLIPDSLPDNMYEYSGIMGLLLLAACGAVVGRVFPDKYLILTSTAALVFIAYSAADIIKNIESYTLWPIGIILLPVIVSPFILGAYIVPKIKDKNQN